MGSAVRHPQRDSYRGAVGVIRISDWRNCFQGSGRLQGCKESAYQAHIQSKDSWSFGTSITVDDKSEEEITQGGLAPPLSGASHHFVTGFPDFLANILIVDPRTKRLYLTLKVDKLKA